MPPMSNDVARFRESLLMEERGGASQGSATNWSSICFKSIILATVIAAAAFVVTQNSKTSVRDDDPFFQRL